MPLGRSGIAPANDEAVGNSAAVSVEVSALQTHVVWIERGLAALSVCLLALAGVTWRGYEKLTDQASNAIVAQQALSGRIDLLDARIGGKLDVLSERLDEDKPSGRGSK